MKITFGSFAVIFFLCFAIARAETPARLRQEIKSDRQEVKEDKQEIRENAQEAKKEEEELRRQIKAALDAGDMVTARALREKIKFMHHENVEQKIQDKRDIQADKRELKSDLNDARIHKYPPVDKDNNPPGKIGGPGTNWENPPGPKGGRGASPDRRRN